MFSATPIPGNERAVNETVDRLYHIGCDVITPREAPIHASGHGYVEELKLMLNLVKPRYVLPIHGDHKRIHLHAELADAVGIDPDDVFRGENGLPLEIDARGARFGEPEQSGMIFVDGVDIGDPADVALRDRRMLSADGIFIVVATVSEQNGESVAPTEVIFRGVPFIEQADGLVEEIRDEVERSLAARPPATASARSTCYSRSSTTTLPRSSTTGCGAGRWCCRWSSRSDPRASAPGPGRGRSRRRRWRHTPGSGSTNRVPGPVARTFKRHRPPCNSATARTIARPSPEPRPPSPPPRTNRSNTRRSILGRDARTVVLDDQRRVAVLGPVCARCAFPGGV